MSKDKPTPKADALRAAGFFVYCGTENGGVDLTPLQTEMLLDVFQDNRITLPDAFLREFARQIKATK